MNEEQDPLEALEAELDGLADSAARPPRLEEIESLSRSSLRRLNIEIAFDVAVLAGCAVASSVLGQGSFQFLSAGVFSLLFLNLVHRFELTHEALLAKKRRELLGQLSMNAGINRLFHGMWFGLSLMLAAAFAYAAYKESDPTNLLVGLIFAVRAPLHAYRFRQFPGPEQVRSWSRRGSAGGKP